MYEVHKCEMPGKIPGLIFGPGKSFPRIVKRYWITYVRSRIKYLEKYLGAKLTPPIVESQMIFEPYWRIANDIRTLIENRKVCDCPLEIELAQTCSSALLSALNLLTAAFQPCMETRNG